MERKDNIRKRRVSRIIVISHRWIAVLLIIMLSISLETIPINAQSSPTSLWRIEKIDNIDYGYYGSIAVDSKGNPHIAYESTYASWDGTKWNYESTPIGGVTCLVIDKNDVPHIGITAGTNSNSLYGNKTGGTWHYTYVDTTNGTYGGDIAIDKDNTVHIVYNVGSNGVKYANISKGVITRYVIDNTNGAEITNDKTICVDNYGHPHIVYDTPITPQYGIKYVMWDGNKWNSSVAINPTSGGSTIAVNDNNTPYIAYTTDPKAYEASWNGTAWESEMFDTVGYYLSIAMDNNQKPHISYIDTSDVNHYKLKHAFLVGTTWNNETIDISQNSTVQMSHTSITIDKDGYVHIAYLKGYEVWYATNKPAGVLEFTTIIIPSIVIIALFIIITKCKNKYNSKQF